MGIAGDRVDLRRVVTLDGTITADPIVAGIDPDARLRGLVVGGQSYDVSADGSVVAN